MPDEQHLICFVAPNRELAEKPVGLAILLYDDDFQLAGDPDRLTSTLEALEEIHPGIHAAVQELFRVVDPGPYLRLVRAEGANTAPHGPEPGHQSR
jgi:hypothetical protein